MNPVIAYVRHKQSILYPVMSSYLVC